MSHSDALRLLMPLPLGETMDGLLEVVGAALDALQLRAQDLAREELATQTWELLEQWERDYGLPDPCTGPLEGIAARRAALLAKLRRKPGQSRAYFIGLAAELGYEIRITEYPVATATTLAAGDGLGVEGSEHVWLVTAPAETEKFFCAGSGAGEPLTSWGNELLICAITRMAPAHTQVVFAFGEE